MTAFLSLVVTVQFQKAIQSSCHSFCSSPIRSMVDHPHRPYLENQAPQTTYHLKMLEYPFRSSTYPKSGYNKATLAYNICAEYQYESG